MNALLSPIKVGLMNLNHRVVLSPLTRFRAQANNVPSDLQVEYYEQRASKGGLLVTEATNINATAGCFPHTPAIYTNEQIEGWKKVTDVVHRKDGHIYLQLWHQGRVGFSFLNPNKEQVVSASAIAYDGKSPMGQPHEVPRALEVAEIKQITQDYTQAALNAIEAGFDGVEIHGANGYLIDQFINSSSNQRTDEYGGSSENRSRFALEVIDGVSKAVGQERTAIRLSPDVHIYDMKDDTPLQTWSYLISQIKERYPKLAYLSLLKNFLNADPNAPKPETDSLDPYRKIWQGPFFASGGYSMGIEDAVEHAEKTGDLIAFGRAFLANPDLPERIRNAYHLNKPDGTTFYSNGPEGYIDYPLYKK